MSLAAGDTLGPYEIAGPLGAGGMGEVYRARDTRLKREVALKVLPAEVARDAERRQRFEQEARAVAALNHPNIVAIYDVGEEGGVLFLVTELVEGKILKGPMPFDAVLKVASQIVDALQAAHDRGIVHRDLKPGNIMLRADGAVKLLDFGLAKSLPEPSSVGERSVLSTETLPMTQAGVVMGTAAYMSPEQAQGLSVDKRTDIWAFGAVLYELLSGRRPFHGSTFTETVASVLKEEPDWDRVPAQAQRLLRKCLAKDPARRLRDIGDAMELVGDEAPSRGKASRHSVWGNSVWALSGVALVLIAAAVAGDRWFSKAPEAERWSGSILGGPEIALDPRVSPDGRLLAFLAIEQGQTQVAVMTPESGNWSVLTHNREVGSPLEISWSPDSASIYYDRHSDVPRGIFNIQVLNGEEKLVLENAAVPEVLPDGTLLVYKLNGQRNLQLFRYWPETGRLQDLPVITRADIIGNSVHISATPDGKEAVVFGTALGQEKEPDRLLAVDVNTGAARPLTPAGVTFERNAVAVAGDGKSVIAAMREDTLRSVVSLPLRGKYTPRTLFTTTSSIFYLDADAAGQVYISAIDQNVEAIRYSPTGTGTEVLAGLSATERGVVSLPDGRVVVAERSLGRSRLMVLTKGRNPAPLVVASEATSPPMTTAGVRDIAFMMGSSHTVIGVGDTASGRVKIKIPTAKGEISSIASSPNGETLYFAAGGKIWSIPSAGGEPVAIRDGGFVVADPDGRSLVISTVESVKARLFRVRLDGGAEQEIMTGPIPILYGGGGLRDGRLLMPMAPVDTWFIVPGILDTATGRVNRVPTDEMSSTNALTWATDGHIVAVVQRFRSTLWRFKPVGKQ